MNAAFDGNLDTYFLSRCDKNLTWILMSFEEVTTVYGIQIYSSSTLHFPFSYQIDGTLDANLGHWEHILLVDKENSTSSNSCSTMALQYVLEENIVLV